MQLRALVYFVLSSPLEHIFDGFDDADSHAADDEMDIYLPSIRTALNIGFAIAIITPAMIFIFWIFHQEPDWYYRRRRY